MMRHSKWHELTKHYRSRLLPYQDVTIGKETFTICKSGNSWYLRNEVHGVLTIPRFMALSLANRNMFTYWFGPYAFVNNFEKTPQGQYLIKMLEYSKLTPVAQHKVDIILKELGYWVQVDHDFMETLRKRDDSKC